MRTFAVDEHGTPVGWSYREFPQYFPQPGWVEHDPDEIWTATLETLAEVQSKLADAGHAVTAIGITNQRETAVVWDRRTGRPLHRAIVWQDRRTAGRCDELRDEGLEPLVRERTGLVLDSYFSATKLEWLLTHGGVDAGPDLAFGTVDSWILWRLTGGPDGGVHATDPSNASRTLLYDIDALRLVRRAVRAVRRAALVPSRGPAQQRALRRDDPRARRRARRAGERHRRRSAVGAVRPGVLRARHDEEHVRHGLVRADEPRCRRTRRRPRAS